jgi:hypothetical protein
MASPHFYDTPGVTAKEKYTFPYKKQISNLNYSKFYLVKKLQIFI